MNLVIDIGNTMIKAAVFEGNELYEFHVFAHHQAAEISPLLSRYLPCPSITSAVAEIPADLLNILKKNKSLFFNHTTKIPVRNLYKTLDTLGKDRLANAVALHTNFHSENALCIDCGTCLKFDFVNKKGEYQGGSISPGLLMRAQSLADYTDQLPLLQPSEHPLVPLTGTDTESSILSGIVNGMTGEINAMISRYEQEYGKTELVLTGGDSSFFAKALKNAIFADRFFTLRGLNEVLIFNA